MAQISRPSFHDLHPAPATIELRSLNQPFALTPDIWTSGRLTEPNNAVLRSERRSHLTGLEASPAVQSDRFAVNIDAYELGRAIYNGVKPQDGEPSWREVGSFGLLRMMVRIDEWSHGEFPGLPEDVASQISELNFCATLRGALVDQTLPLSLLDCRYGYIQFHWIGAIKDLSAGSIIQTMLVNELVNELRTAESRNKLQSWASQRFPLGRELELREGDALAAFSDHELALKGITPADIKSERLLREAKFPDVRSPAAEALFGASTIVALEPVDEAFAVHHQVPSDEILLELPETTALRHLLKRVGFLLSDLPDEIEAQPTNQFLVEFDTESQPGLKLYLRLKAASSKEEQIEWVRTLGNSLFNSTAGGPLEGRIQPRLSYSASLSKKRAASKAGPARFFAEFDIPMPELHGTNESLKRAMLAAVADLFVQHKRFFQTR